MKALSSATAGGRYLSGQINFPTMKQRLLAIAFSTLFIAGVSAQDCGLPAANICDSAKFICGFRLEGYQGNNAGYVPAPDIPGFGICGNFHNPQFFQIVPCATNLSLTVFSFNCTTGDGLQVALADSCDGQIIACNGGFGGGANAPLFISANVEPGEPYILIIDGFLGDACDFVIQDVGGMDLTPPTSITASQPGYISFQAFPCGGGTLTLHLPVCQQNMSAGCEESWTDFYLDNCVSLNWNLPPGTEIVSSDPHALTIDIKFNQPVINGAVSVSLSHDCPGIDLDECKECIPRCCTGPVLPIAISSPPPCSTPYTPPDCQNFNLPAPPADSCHLAPYFSGGCLDGFCGTNAGFTPDQPVSAGDTFPIFENNGWLRIAPCEDSIAIDFQVFDCQTGDELGFFLLSGDCDTMTLLTFISAKDGNVAHLTASGLAPGEVYFLAVDGFYNSECKFQAHVLDGFSLEPDSVICSNCTPSTIDGPTDLCPGDFATYTFTPGGCDVMFVGGNNQNCPSPDLCKLDTVALHWTIPPFMNFVSDSVGVYTITVQVDTNLIGIDTVLTGQVGAYWAPVTTPSDTSGGGGFFSDDNNFCSCGWADPGCVSPIIPLDVTVHHDVEIIDGELTCDFPCFFYNGQPYCTPGEYIVEQTNCETKKLIITDNIIFPIADAGPDKYICVGQSASIGAPPFVQYAYLWNNGSSASQQTVSPPVTTTYVLYVTDVSNGCTSGDAVTVFVNLGPYITHLAPITICEGDCIYVAGEELCSGGNHVIVAESYQGCDSVIFVTIIEKPYAITNHGTVGTLTCAVNSISFMGNTYNQPGNYTVPDPGGCGEHTFTIVSDNTTPFVDVSPPQQICLGETAVLTASSNLPFVIFHWSNGATGSQITVAPTSTTSYTVIATNTINGCIETKEVIVGVNPPVDTDLGVAGILSCNQLSVNFLGNTYTQPGQYSVPKPNGCGNDNFVIAGDITAPWCPVLPVPPICVGESAILQTAPPVPSDLLYFWNTGDTTQEITVTPLVSTNYTVTATNPANGCSSIVTTAVVVNQPQLVQLGTVGTITCAQPCFTFNGEQYCQPGTYSYTANCEIKEFQIGEDLSLPTVHLGTVGTITCAQPCFTFNGEQYCQLGTYSYTENCEIKEFQIGEDLSLPTVQLGTVGTITCAQPCFTFNGEQYCQPGTYSYTANCEIKEFQIGEDLSLPTVQLGTVGTITCAQPCFTFNGQEYCQPGTYSVAVNCENQQFEIDDLPPVWLELGADKTIAAGESVEIEAQTNAQPSIITWHNSVGTIPGSDLSITVQPAENTLYSLEIQDLNGCLLEDSVWVLVEKAEGGWFAPNVIKPESADLNGRFTLFAGSDYITEIQLLEIYDRWGNLVFVRNNFLPNVPELGWDGTQSGKMLDPAVFVWHAELLLYDGTIEKVKGDVAVVR